MKKRGRALFRGGSLSRDNTVIRDDDADNHISDDDDNNIKDKNANK